MGDKGKGKNSGKNKKPKAAAMVDKRPHEQRAREAVKSAPELLVQVK